MKTIKLTLEDGKIVEFRHGEDEPSIVSEIRKGLNEHSFRIYNTLYLGVTLMLKEWFDEHAMDSQKVIKAEYLMNGEIIDTLLPFNDEEILTTWHLQNGAFAGKSKTYSLEKNDKELITFLIVKKV